MKIKSRNIIISVLVVAMIAVVALVMMIVTDDATVYAEHLELSEKYSDELEYDLAIAELEKAIELEPKKVEAYLVLADIYLEKGRYYVDEYNELDLKVKRSEYNKIGKLKNSNMNTMKVENLISGLRI